MPSRVGPGSPAFQSRSVGVFRLSPLAHAPRSVLEPGRTLTLAEKGGAGAEVIVAAPAFRLVATMNPGALAEEEHTKNY